MSRKLFTEGQQQLLRQNPYIYSVTETRITLTKEFKELFMTAYKAGQSPRKIGSKRIKSRKTHHVSIMGDESIEIRGKDENFQIQPIRRSFSMDSAVDCDIYLSVQDIIRNHEEASRTKRPFFSFGHTRGSRSAILPLEF